MAEKEAAEAERATLLAQAAEQHEDRILTEMRRYKRELEHIQTVYEYRI